MTQITINSTDSKKILPQNALQNVSCGKFFEQFLDSQKISPTKSNGLSPEAVVTAILFSFMGYFSGHGKTLFVMTQSMLQTFLVRLPVAYIMASQPDPSLAMIGTAAPLATVFGIFFNVCYYFYCRKKRII